MGKRLEDLNLIDQPIVIPTPRQIDPRDTAWYRFLQEIDDLLATGAYTWAESTLSDIRDTVERMQVVTVGQRRAVTNIEEAGLRKRGGSRRYEGFRR